MRELTADNCKVKILDSRRQMGCVAAEEIVLRIKELLSKKEHINMIFAAAPSQNEVLESLTESSVEWGRINAFHMDEYIGLDKNAPQTRQDRSSKKRNEKTLHEAFTNNPFASLKKS